MARWGRKEYWDHDPLGRSPVAVAGIPLGHIEVWSRNEDLEVAGFH